MQASGNQRISYYAYPQQRTQASPATSPSPQPLTTAVVKVEDLLPPELKTEDVLNASRACYLSTTHLGWCYHILNVIKGVESSPPTPSLPAELRDFAEVLMKRLPTGLSEKIARISGVKEHLRQATDELARKVLAEVQDLMKKVREAREGVKPEEVEQKVASLRSEVSKYPPVVVKTLPEVLKAYADQPVAKITTAVVTEALKPIGLPVATKNIIEILKQLSPQPKATGVEETTVVAKELTQQQPAQAQEIKKVVEVVKGLKT